MEGPRPSPLFLMGGEGVSAAEPVAEPVLKAENGSQMVDEHNRSTKLDDLNVENWPLEKSFLHESSFQTYQALN